MLVIDTLQVILKWKSIPICFSFSLSPLSSMASDVSINTTLWLYPTLCSKSSFFFRWFMRKEHEADVTLSLCRCNRDVIHPDVTLLRFKCHRFSIHGWKWITSHHIKYSFYSDWRSSSTCRGSHDLLDSQWPEKTSCSRHAPVLAWVITRTNFFLLFMLLRTNDFFESKATFWKS